MSSLKIRRLLGKGRASTIGGIFFVIIAGIGISSRVYRHMGNENVEKASTVAATEMEVITTELAEIGTTYDAQLNQFVALGGMDTSQIESKEDLESRREALKASIALRKEGQAMVAGTQSRIASRLESEGIRSSIIGDFNDEFSKDVHWIMMGRYYQTEVDLLTQIDSYLAFLSDSYGEWDVDPQTGLVEFYESISESEIATFNKYADEIDRLSSKLDRLGATIQKGV